MLWESVPLREVAEVEVVAGCPRDVGEPRWPLVRATLPPLCSHFPARFVEVRSRSGDRMVGFPQSHAVLSKGGAVLRTRCGIVDQSTPVPWPFKLMKTIAYLLIDFILYIN